MRTTMSETLRLLDERLAHGQATITSSELRNTLGLSPQSTSNLLRRWLDAGLVDRVARGKYAIRQLGLLGTRAASEDVALAVGALWGDHPHRIAYRSALDVHGLLTHPARTIQVASPHRVRVTDLSGRALRVVMEPEAHIRAGAKPAAHGAWVSGLERALLDIGSRPDLVGGYTILAEALVNSDADPKRLSQLATQIDAAPALRRLGSLADQLELAGLAGELSPLSEPTSDLDLEPGLNASDRQFRDSRWRVRWPEAPRSVALALEQ